MAAYHPEQPSPQQQRDAAAFVQALARSYPCTHCAEDFRGVVAASPPRVDTRLAFVQWMCEAHNEVNDHLGKPRFDCSRADERWRRRGTDHPA